jgi:hypothetical protein
MCMNRLNDYQTVGAQITEYSKELNPAQLRERIKLVGWWKTNFLIGTSIKLHILWRKIEDLIIWIVAEFKISSQNKTGFYLVVIRQGMQKNACLQKERRVVAESYRKTKWLSCCPNSHIRTDTLYMLSGISKRKGMHRCMEGKFFPAYSPIFLVSLQDLIHFRYLAVISRVWK